MHDLSLEPSLSPLKSPPQSSVLATVNSVKKFAFHGGKQQATKYRLAQRVYKGGPSPAKRVLVPIAHDGRTGTLRPKDGGNATSATSTRCKEYEEVLRRRDFVRVLWMIENGDVAADYEAPNGETALLAAVAAKHFESVQLLLRHHLTINHTNRHGYTPLIKAIAAASPFSESNAKNQSQESFDNDMLEFVLSYDPDLFHKDGFGKTAFDWAKRTSNHAAIALLEAKKNSKQMFLQQSSYQEERIRECVAYLSVHDDIVMQLTTMLQHPLYDATAFHQFLTSASSQLSREVFDAAVHDLQQLAPEHPMVQRTTAFFIDFETRDGWTPLTKAAANGDVESVRLLLDHGADLHHETRLRHTAFTWACYCGHEAVCLHLLRRNVRLNQQTSEGRTALMHAVANSQFKIVHHLLRYLYERSFPTSAKQSFLEDTMTLKRRATIKSFKEEDSRHLEWHEEFERLLSLCDRDGKTAFDMAKERFEVSAKEEEAPERLVVVELEKAMAHAHAHREYVAVNRERTEVTQCRFEGCTFLAPKDLLSTHELHYCPKRRIPCEQCGCDIVYEDQATHDATECAKRLVSCVHVQYGCKQTLVFDERLDHERFHCRKRPIACRLECGKTVKADEIDGHEATECPLRTIECPQGCSVTMLAKEAKTHCRMHCNKRLMPCYGLNTGTGGCGELVVWEQMAFHVKELCVKRRIACKWSVFGCNETIGGMIESRKFHEEQQCPFRQTACRNAGCPQSGKLLVCFLLEHYAWQCLQEPKTCPNACGQSMAAHELLVHVLSDAGDCPRRQTRCRLDLCGKRIKLFDGFMSDSTVTTSDVQIETTESASVSLRALEQRVQASQAFLDRLHAMATSFSLDTDRPQSVQATSRPMTSSKMVFSHPLTISYLQTWLSASHQQLEGDLNALRLQKESKAIVVRVLTFSVEDQKHLIELPDGRSEWISLFRREYEVLMPTTNPTANTTAFTFGCGWIQASHLPQHEANECALRLVPCPLHCGQRLSVQNVRVHLAKRCNMRNATCRLGCSAVMPFLSLLEHEELHCDLRIVFCEHCHASMTAHLLSLHLQKSCDRVLRRCRLGCALKLASADFEKHETVECPKRLVTCASCDKRIWFSEQEMHASEECPLRTAGPCPANCGHVLTHNHVTFHLLYECHQRLVTCPQCHQKTKLAELDHHKTLLCAQRQVYCRKGCGMLINDIKTADHEDHDCIKRVVYCPNQCGLQLPFHQIPTHVDCQCTMRIVACPNDCGERLFAYQMENHWKRCRQRLCACGAGAKACLRPIRLWFKDRKLVTCAVHKEHALLWALKTQDDDLATYFLNNVDDDQVNLECANGFTPLTIAASMGNVELVKILLRFGADVNLETSRGRTPLAEAVMMQSIAIVELLVQNRAIVAHTNRHGRHLMTMARSLVVAAKQDEEKRKAEAILKILEERLDDEKTQRDLFLAIAMSDYAFVTEFFRYSSGTKYYATQLDELQQQVMEKEALAIQAQRELEDAVMQFNESLADADAKSALVLKLTEEVDHCKTQMTKVEIVHEASMAESNLLEVDMHQFIRQITAHDIAKLVNEHVPPANYLVVMKAICMLCGVMPRGRRNATEYTDMEWWKTAQALLMDRSLLQKLRGYRNNSITPDVMNKVRRECLRQPSFMESTKAFADVMNQTATAVGNMVSSGARALPVRNQRNRRANNRRASRLPSIDAMNGDIVSILATWVKGVEMEYKSDSERQALGEKKRQLHDEMDGASTGLQRAAFDMKVATRSLPARQEELDAAKAKAEAAERELKGAKQRIKVRKLLHFVALSGHTPLSFACAIGNEAMVHILITHGANCGFADEEKELCASLIQLIVRHVLQKRKQAQQTRSRSDAAIDALVKNVAYSFLLQHFIRKIRFFRQTHRVPLHEAVVNGFPHIAPILLESGAVLWQKTYVLPQRVFPGRIELDPSFIPSDLKRLGGWKLQPLGKSSRSQRPTTPSSPFAAPMSVYDTMVFAVRKFNCLTFRRDAGGWRNDLTVYGDAQFFVENAWRKMENRMASHRHELAARKNVAKKANKMKKLHQALEEAIFVRDFLAISKCLDEGAFADYETQRCGHSALMVASMDEVYVVNADQQTVLAIDFLLDRESNRPFVNFESSTGWTALRMAAHHGRLKCLQALLERGANVNHTTRTRGETALMAAARNGSLQAVEFLLHVADCDVLIKDASGKTAYDHAKDHQFEAIVRLLGAAMGGNRGRVFSAYKAIYGVCKWGCGFMVETEAHDVVDGKIVRERYPLQDHEDHACYKRLVHCPNHCGQDIQLWFENLESHLKHDCPLRLVTCPQPKCTVQYQFKDTMQHQQHECLYRTIHCDCGESMPFQKHVLHAATQCPLRLVSCPFQCDQSMGLMKAIDLKTHVKSECPLRHVRCRNGCSFQELRAKDRDRHEQQTCPLRRVQCKWSCEELVLAHMQQQHEANECFLRHMLCPNRCGDENVAFATLEEHLTQKCARRLVICRLGCGRKIPNHQMEHHLQSECRKRMVVCPLGCHESVQDEEMTTHLSIHCSLRISVCGLCGQTNIPHATITHHRAHECRMRPVTCKYSNCMQAKLLAHEKEHHEQFQCAFRPIYCHLGCGQTMIAHEAKAHERTECRMKIRPCQYDCGFEGRAQERLEHEELYCPVKKWRPKKE